MATQKLDAPVAVDAEPDERYAKYQARAEELLVHADRIMAKISTGAAADLTPADRIQLSEKAWGSVQYTLQAIAATQGWVYGRTAAADQMKNYIQRLLPEQERGRFSQAFNAIRVVHQNFYRDHLAGDDLVGMVDTARYLNEQMWRAAGGIPADAQPPSMLLMHDDPAVRDIALRSRNAAR